ncbi:MAG: FecR family protein [Candidatus Korobacteraceae bacterium]
MFRTVLAAVLSLLLIALPAWADPAGDQTAGAVKALLPDASDNAHPLAINDTLHWNDLLQTNTKGRLRAGLTDGSILSLGSNSQLRVVQHDAAAQQTSLDLNYGKLRNQVVKITQPGGKYEVRTPNAVIGVIGTDFYVAYANGRTTVICYDGTLAVTPGAGAKVVDSNNATTGATSGVSVAAGQMVVIGFKVAGGGMQSYPNMMKASQTDTGIPQHVKSHLARNITIGAAIAVAGLTVGLTQINSSPKPCGCK